METFLLQFSLALFLFLAFNYFLIQIFKYYDVFQCFLFVFESRNARMLTEFARQNHSELLNTGFA